MFKVQKTPLVSTVEHTLKRLISYHIAVVFMTVIALVLQAFIGLEYAFYGFLQVLIAVAFSSALVFVYQLIRKHDTTRYRDYMTSITHALLASLLLPAQAPFYVIIITIIIIKLFSFIFTLLFKKHIIHPVLLAILIVQLMFRDSLAISETMVTIFNADELPFSRIQFFFGLYEGLTLGTSAFFILFILWIYLSVTKIIHVKMSVLYVLHMLIGVIVFAIFREYTLWNTFTLLLLGYTALMLVFFVSEPTSTPETDEMMIIYPLIAVILTIWFRLQFDIIEAAIYALVFAQFISWVIEQFQTRTFPRVRNVLTIASGIVWVGIIIFLSL